MHDHYYAKASSCEKRCPCWRGSVSSSLSPNTRSSRAKRSRSSITARVLVISSTPQKPTFLILQMLMLKLNYDRDKYYAPQILNLQWPVFRDDDSVFQRLINSARASGVAVFKPGLSTMSTKFRRTQYSENERRIRRTLPQNFVETFGNIYYR